MNRVGVYSVGFIKHCTGRPQEPGDWSKTATPDEVGFLTRHLLLSWIEKALTDPNYELTQFFDEDGMTGLTLVRRNKV